MRFVIQICRALEENTYNHITATYFLLAERKLRSTRFGVKTPTRGRKQMLAQPPRVAPGLPAMQVAATQDTTRSFPSTDIVSSTITTHHVPSGMGSPYLSMHTTTPTSNTTPSHVPNSTTTNNNHNTVSNYVAPLVEVASNDLQTTLTSAPTVQSATTNNTIATTVGSGRGNGPEGLAVPASRLARKCSIVKEGEEDESSMTSPTGLAKVPHLFNARTSTTRVSI